MFESVIHAWQVRKLHREKKRLQAFYRDAAKNAKASEKSEVELERLFFEERMEIETIDAEIHHLTTQRLIEIADKYLIPHPEFDSKSGAWIQSSVSGRWHLTLEAMAELRAAVRQERKERSESWRMWLAALTGLVGALIGLASLLLKK